MSEMNDKNGRKDINPTTDRFEGDNAAAGRLDDEQRVKVLSPGMMVFKRFVKNKLAITGLIILVAMFLFSFLGGLLSPYDQAEVFKHDEAILKEYAGAIYNEDLRYYVKEGHSFPTSAQAQFVLAANNGQETFTANGQTYTYVQEGEGFYIIQGSINIAEISTLANSFRATPLEGREDQLTDAVIAAAQQAVDAGHETFELDGVTYTLTKSGKMYGLGISEDMAVATLLVCDAYLQEDAAAVDTFEFRQAVEHAVVADSPSFTLGENTYEVVEEEDLTIVYLLEGGGRREFATLSGIIVSPVAADVFLSVEFKTLVRETIIDHGSSFEYTDDAGVTQEYRIDRVNRNYYVKTNQVSRLITMYEAPSSVHPLGTDGNGMDVLTRLMYGGRISLMVGFVAIFIELFIGVIVGGISGYFGGWVDTCLMRFVDLFNCLPFYPIVMIIGAVMDQMEVAPLPRIFILMAVLGVLGWTGVARTVRGQILSLREQDFMVATEATGIKSSRRIFRHLVPNVMPLLIVYATMGLGGIIISEATLSFLGLGVKYPLASWGSIINAANNIHVMTNYWFIWIPAGLLILLTVLGFNFVGDGLRDAFDPKMKR